ncbi:rRNA maturation RNase YbeY [bacterium]|nr:rRNA maturation RNase YbeY [bacterium]
MEILVKSIIKGKGFKPSLVRRVAKKALKAARPARSARRSRAGEGYREVQVSILFCSDPYIKRLNKEYREVNAPTDVLAFSMHGGRFPKVHPEILGDVVISLETASRQAKRFRHSLDEEIVLLVVHGILHLLGYDHLKNKDKELMRRKEKQILRVISRRVGK